MKTNKIITLIILFVSYVPVYAQSVFDSELKERLENPRRIHIVIDQEYEGFHIEAVLHPDDNDNYVGMATFTFSGKGKSLSIDTPYYWRWSSCLNDLPKGGDIQYKGETYHVSEITDCVQGDDPEIKETYPLCFKDVDFDGQKEICFSSIGYNRIYYSAHKIISPAKASYLFEPPYNNIVYGYEGSTTIFDYKAKTIKVHEQIGCCKTVDDLYVRRDTVLNVLNPMVLVNHSEYAHTTDE